MDTKWFDSHKRAIEHEPHAAVEFCNRVFVYGTLKRGHGNHRLLRNSVFLGSGSTAQRFPLYVRGLPYLYPQPNSGEHVLGEVYQVDPQTMARLDKLEGHPRFYCRILIDIQGDPDYPPARAWAYFINSVMESSEPVAEYVGRMGQLS